jgi:enterochelin esterase-like enzyme
MATPRQRSDQGRWRWQAADVAIVMFVPDRHVTHPRSRDSRQSRGPPGAASVATAEATKIGRRFGTPPGCHPRGTLVGVTQHGQGRRRTIVGLGVIVAVITGCTGRNDPPSPALATTVVAGPHGQAEHVHLTGSSFGAYGDYSIYLPPGYGQDPRLRYPVVYLLHGGSDTVDFFLELGLQKDIQDALSSGAVGPMLVVLVDGGPKFDGDGSMTSFDDYLATELIPDVDHRWRTLAEQSGRAVGGVSLGGRHALEFAAGHPSLVAAAGGHSTTVPRSPEALAAARIPIYLDVGTSDGLYDDDAALARELARLGADVRWHPAPGTHGRPYWSAHLPDYLRFYSDALGATGNP